jgi:hypothetical protein
MSEQLEIRCPKLGNQVTFAYCLRESGDIPCPRTIQCWHSYFPVEDYLREKLTPAEWERCFNQTPKEKISTLIELIEAAKNKPVK